MIFNAAGWKHLHPPIRAEPAMGEEQPDAQIHENKIKRKEKTKLEGAAVSRYWRFFVCAG